MLTSRLKNHRSCMKWLRQKQNVPFGSHLSTKFLLMLKTPQTSLEFMFQLLLERECSTITDTFNPFVLFSSQRTCFGIFPICFFRGNIPKVNHVTPQWYIY